MSKKSPKDSALTSKQNFAPTSEVMPSGLSGGEIPPDFSIGLLTVKQAALIVAKCLAFEGQIEAILPEQDSYSIFDETLDNCVQEQAGYLAEKIRIAIDNGYLKAATEARDIENNLHIEQTLVSFYTVTDWLVACGFDTGDFFFEYLDFLGDVWQKIDNAINAAMLGKQKHHRLENKSQQELIDELQLETHKRLELSRELDSLKKSIDHTKPVALRQETSYLNIIGALVGLLLEKSPRVAGFKTQQAIIDAIHDKFGDRGGLSKRNLEDKFVAAKRSLDARD